MTNFKQDLIRHLYLCMHTRIKYHCYGGSHRSHTLHEADLKLSVFQGQGYPTFNAIQAFSELAMKDMDAFTFAMCTQPCTSFFPFWPSLDRCQAAGLNNQVRKRVHCYNTEYRGHTRTTKLNIVKTMRPLVIVAIFTHQLAQYLRFPDYQSKFDTCRIYYVNICKATKYGTRGGGVSVAFQP